MSVKSYQKLLEDSDKSFRRMTTLAFVMAIVLGGIALYESYHDALATNFIKETSGNYTQSECIDFIVKDHVVDRCLKYCHVLEEKTIIDVDRTVVGEYMDSGWSCSISYDGIRKKFICSSPVKYFDCRDGKEVERARELIK